jgi:hypothetical protein
MNMRERNTFRIIAKNPPSKQNACVELSQQLQGFRASVKSVMVHYRVHHEINSPQPTAHDGGSVRFILVV